MECAGVGLLRVLVINEAGLLLDLVLGVDDVVILFLAFGTGFRGAAIGLGFRRH